MVNLVVRMVKLVNLVVMVNGNLVVMVSLVNLVVRMVKCGKSGCEDGKVW